MSEFDDVVMGLQEQINMLNERIRVLETDLAAVKKENERLQKWWNTSHGEYSHPPEVRDLHLKTQNEHDSIEHQSPPEVREEENYPFYLNRNQMLRKRAE